MPEFDQKKAYVAEREGTFFDDGREEELVEFVTNHPNRNEIKGSPSKVLAAIDEYGRTKKYLMNVGEDKGKIVTNIIRERKPDTMVELGGHCGYSTILFSSTLRESDGKRYLSLERSPKFTKVIETFVKFAGLDDVARVVVGPSNDGIKKIHQEGVKTIDMMFLDHYKPGTVLAADNCISPGNPPYLEYVRSTVEEKRFKLTQDSKADTDAFGSRDPDGVEITECLGEVDV